MSNETTRENLQCRQMIKTQENGRPALSQCKLIEGHGGPHITQGRFIPLEAQAPSNFAKEVDDMLCDLLQMVHTLKNEWLADGCWSEWDEETLQKAHRVHGMSLAASAISEKEGDVNDSNTNSDNCRHSDGDNRLAQQAKVSSILAATSSILEATRELISSMTPEELVEDMRKKGSLIYLNLSPKPEGKTLDDAYQEVYLKEWDRSTYLTAQQWRERRVKAIQAVAEFAVKPYDQALTSIHQRWADKVVELAKANQQLSIVHARAEKAEKDAERLAKPLKIIVAISDRYHDAWIEAKEALSLHASLKGSK